VAVDLIFPPFLASRGGRFAVGAPYAYAFLCAPRRGLASPRLAGFGSFIERI
jgi:hypothetical protein